MKKTDKKTMGRDDSDMDNIENEIDELLKIVKY